MAKQSEPFVRALVRFARPHTIIGTTLSVVGLYVMAAALGGYPFAAGSAALAVAWLACIMANLYIVGLNQLTDVEIDRINKPNLPVASGRFSERFARRLVAATLAVAVALSIVGGAWLFATVAISCVLGTAYSLPPFRLKRFHFWAAFCILAVRGLVVNLLLYLHFATVLGAAPTIPDAIWLLTAFVFGLSVVIAWFKDLPDMTGDRRFGIRTLTLTLGSHTVFRLGIGLLTACCLLVIIAALTGISGLNNPVMATTNACLLALALVMAGRVKPDQRTSASRYYYVIWGLFFSAYILFPLAAVL
jgi:homogentisate phytyltransferase / homogentisate geranylgeranyltransferase